MDTNGAQGVLWPLAAYGAAVLLLAAFMVVSSHLLGQRHMDAQTGEPYESGIRPTGAAWIHFDVKYYLIAMFFVIFDVESVFVYAWAVALRQAGWPGFTAMAVFIGLLLAALAYLWRMGGLDWAVFAGAERDSRKGKA